MLARHYNSQRDLDRSRTLYEKILALAPNSSQALGNAGYFFGLLGEHKRARELFGRAIEIAPDNAYIHTYLCSSLVQAGQIEVALELAETLVRRFPNHFEACLARGQVLLAIGRVNEAAALSEEVEGRFPEDPAALDFRGRILFRKGALDPLTALARRMISNFDESPRGYNLLAASLVRNGRTQEAFQIQKQGLEQAPKDPETLWCAAQVARQSGKTEEAHEWLARFEALDIVPHIETAPIGQRADKLFWLKEGLGLHPVSPEQNRAQP